MNQRVSWSKTYRTHRPSAVGSVFSWLIAAVWLIASAGCGRVPELHLRIDDTVRLPDRQVVIFVVDGMDAERTAGLIDEGRLPHIRRRFVDGGVRFTRAFGVFPSVTYANCTSIITGRLPDDHGIIGNTWYEPSTATFRDYGSIKSYLRVNADLRAPTLFELLPAHPTLNLHFIMSRGADLNYRHGTRAKILWGLGFHEASDRQIIQSMGKALRAIRKQGTWPALTVAYLPSVDEVGHRCGPDSPEYVRALENADRILGRFIDAYAEAGLDAATCYMLLSDHSMVATPEPHRINLVDWFRQEAGQRVWAGGALPDEQAKRRAVLAEYDMILNVDAGRVARIYLPGRKHDTLQEHTRRFDEWYSRICPLILDHPAIDLSLSQDVGGGVSVHSRRGSANITIGKNHPAEYRIAGYEGDPLGYRQYDKLAPYLDGRTIPGHLELSLTADTDYPDLPRQAVDLFRSERAGDVILTAAGDWTFHPTWKGGHGAPLPGDMRIPLYVAGPGMAAGKVDHPVRCVDVLPTVLQWLDIEKPEDHMPQLDGEPLQSQLDTVQ